MNTLRKAGYSIPNLYTSAEHWVYDVPLFQQVRRKLSYWRSIGAPKHVLNWIAFGVDIQPTYAIPYFF